MVKMETNFIDWTHNKVSEKQNKRENYRKNYGKAKQRQSIENFKDNNYGYMKLLKSKLSRLQTNTNNRKIRILISVYEIKMLDTNK